MEAKGRVQAGRYAQVLLDLGLQHREHIVLFSTELPLLVVVVRVKMPKNARATLVVNRVAARDEQVF